MVYQITSDAEILVDCEIFVGHVHLLHLIFLSHTALRENVMSLWRFLSEISVENSFSRRGSFNEEESEFIRFSLESNLI